MTGTTTTMRGWWWCSRSAAAINGHLLVRPSSSSSSIFKRTVTTTVFPLYCSPTTNNHLSDHHYSTNNHHLIGSKEEEKKNTVTMSRAAGGDDDASAPGIGDQDHHLQSPGFEKPRYVVKKVMAKPQHEGEGAVVRRSIGRSELKNLDPFLMLDEFSVSAPAGFPDHPHRGFETVTYMLQGAFTHQDFSGHKGTIRTGDLQWMTAGRGIIHSEMPAGEGIQKGLQLWINLSSSEKMIEPRYQELQSKDISRVERDGVDVRIIAGEAFGVKSPVYTRTPTMYLDFTLKPGAQLHQRIPEPWNSFVYVVEGDGLFGGGGGGGGGGNNNNTTAAASSHHVLVLSPGGDGVSVWNKSGKPLRFVLIGGQPLNEPVVQYGPFVMNTQEEIERTIEDYHFCRNGFENAKHWKSQTPSTLLNH